MERSANFTVLRMLIALVMLGLAAFGSASGISVGAAYTPGQPSGSFTANASWAFAHWHVGADAFSLAVRAEASFIPESGAAPAYGLAAVIGVSEPGSPELQIGSGIGLATASPPITGPALAVYGFAGLRFLLAGPLHGTVEYHIAASSLAVAHGVRLGFEWKFGEPR